MDGSPTTEVRKSGIPAVVSARFRIVTAQGLKRLGEIRQTTIERAAALRTALREQRHGTWLMLFGLTFTLLWLGAGWLGMANGLGRGLVVGTVTPVIVNALYPLKRRR